MTVRARAWRRDAAICAALLALAAAARVLFLFGTTDRGFPWSVFYYGDSRLYREFALAILAGQPFDQGIPYHPPAFAWVLSRVIALTGESPTSMRAILAVLSSTVAPLTYLLGVRIWGRAVAIVGALLVTFSFGAMVAAVSANTETIYLPILTGQVLFVTMLAEATALRRVVASRVLAVVSGVLLGIGALTRVEHLGFAWMIPAALLVARPGLGIRRVASWSAGVAAVAAIVLAPWVVASRAALVRWNAAHAELAAPLPTLVPVSGYGPLNFALANRPGADGTFRPDAAVQAMGRGSLDLRDPRQLELYRHGYRIGLAYLAENPGEATRLVARKVALATDGLALGWGAADRPAGLVGVRRPVDLFVPQSRSWKLVSIVLLVLGLALSRGVARRAAPAGLVLLHALLVAAAFFGYARGAVQVLPVVFLFQAAALVAVVRLAPWPRARRSAAFFGVGVAVLLLVELVVRAGSPTSLVASGSVDAATGKLVQDAEISLAPRR